MTKLQKNPEIINFLDKKSYIHMEYDIKSKIYAYRIWHKNTKNEPTEKGLYHLAIGTNKPYSDFYAIIKDTIVKGIFSKRPYMINMGFDQSQEACIYAIFSDFCLRQGINPWQMILRTEGLFEYEEDFWDIVQFGYWQGVNTPSLYQYLHFVYLLTALEKLGLSNLVEELSKLETIVLPNYELRIETSKIELSNNQNKN